MVEDDAGRKEQMVEDLCQKKRGKRARKDINDVERPDRTRTVDIRVTRKRNSNSPRPFVCLDRCQRPESATCRCALPGRVMKVRGRPTAATVMTTDRDSVANRS